MKTHIIIFYGDNIGPFGIPEPYYCYAIIVSRHPGSNDKFNASVLSASRGSPADIDGTRLITSDTEASALALALNALKDHPAHKDLAIEEGALAHHSV